MEVLESVIFSQLFLNYEARLEKVLKQLKFRRLPVKRGHCCGERFWQFGDYVDNVMEFFRVDFARHLRKVQQNFVCFDRRWGVPTAELQLIGRAVPFLFF